MNEKFEIHIKNTISIFKSQLIYVSIFLITLFLIFLILTFFNDFIYNMFPILSFIIIIVFIIFLVYYFSRINIFKYSLKYYQEEKKYILQILEKPYNYAKDTNDKEKSKLKNNIIIAYETLLND